MLFHPFSIKKRKISALVGWSLFTKTPITTSSLSSSTNLVIGTQCFGWTIEFESYKIPSSPSSPHSSHPHLLIHNASINISGVLTGHLWGSRCSGHPKNRPQKCSQPGGSPRCPIKLLQPDCIKGPDVQSTARCADMRHVQGTDAHR